MRIIQIIQIIHIIHIIQIRNLSALKDLDQEVGIDHTDHVSDDLKMDHTYHCPMI